MMERTSNPILHRLQQTLETNASREEVTDALSAAETLGGELPELLRYRAQERIDADRFLGRRRIAFGVACALFVFLCVISTFGLTTITHLRAYNQDEAKFEQLIETQQWQEAQTLLDGLDATTKSQPAFVEGQQAVQQAIARDQQRQSEFAEIAEQLGTEKNLDSNLVSRLIELAESPEEQQIAQEFSAQADELDLQRKAKQVESQSDEFQSLQNDVEQFLEVESVSLDTEERSTRIRELRGKLQQFVTSNHLSNPELSEAAKQTAELLVREDQRAHTKSQRQDLVDDITAAVGELDRFVRAADRFATVFPDDPMSKPLMELVANQSTLKATTSWIAVQHHPAYLSPSTADGISSQRWLQLLEDAESLDRDHPFAKTAALWREHYLAIAKRPEAIKHLQQLFQEETFAKMYVYRENRRAYYSDLAPDRESPTAHVIEYFANLKLQKATKNFGSRYRQQVQPNATVAEHSLYASRALKALSRVDHKDFTPTVYRMISELREAGSNGGMDPILKLKILRDVMKIGLPASVPLQAGFSDLQKTLEASDFPWEANWLSPDDSNPQVVAARDQARKILKEVPDWEGSVKRMGQSFRGFHEPRPEAPKWIGWVSRDSGGFSSQWKSTPVQNSFVVAPKDGGSDFVLVPISLDPGSAASLDPGAQHVGALICWIPKSKASPVSNTD